MNEQNKALSSEGLIPCAQKPEVTRRDRLFLTLAFCFCFLLADTFDQPWGMGNTVTVFAWFLLLLPFMGREALVRRKESRVLLAANLALAASFALTSNPFFRWWNFLALTALVPLHAISLSSGDHLPWWKPAMLWERFLLLVWGLFGNLWAPFAGICQAKEKRDTRRILAAVLGVCGALVLVSVLLPLLLSADALFVAALCSLRFSAVFQVENILWRLFWAAVITPFVFSFLFSLRNPKPLRKAEVQTARLDSFVFLPIMAALDGLYLLFLAVQSAGLFGGPSYLASHGLSYAEWARSGFFQMMSVTGINLVVILAALCLTRQEGRGWAGLRALMAVLAAESLVLLASAAWRMSLYVAAYGLSFKRCMTYWGMVMMALLLLIACLKIRRPEFGFCRLAFPLALAGWLAVNCLPLDWLVARDQVDRYLACEALGGTPSISVSYLVYDLSYDTLPQLARLDGRLTFFDRRYGCERPLSEILERRRLDASRDCSDWHTWSLSARIVF